MKLRFGTDGVRGRAYEELTVADAYAIGRAAAAVLKVDRAVIAHDSRESGEDLAAGLAAGLAADGVASEFLGVAPTPAVAFVAARDGVLGAMISASHNPWHDNGIKLFTPGGHKLSDDQQSEMERLLAADEEPGAEVRSIAWVPAAERHLADYRRLLLGTVPPNCFDGMKIVIDAANGAASHVVGTIFVDLGADVVLLASEPNGRNINDDCGSTYPGPLAAAVLAEGADLGLALDGDADRLLAIDHTGAVVDGDHIIAVCAIDLADQGRLRDSTVVVTVMTNLGFRLAMKERAITVVETPVGDRHVLAALAENGWTLGGEQSGHVIFPEIATTGDGILTGLQLTATVARSGRSLRDLSQESMTQLPQVLENVPIARRVTDVAAELAEDIASIEAGLGDSGRVLVRSSGTEPLIRVMVEAPTEELAQRSCRQLVERVQARFGRADS